MSPAVQNPNCTKSITAAHLLALQKEQIFSLKQSTVKWVNVPLFSVRVLCFIGIKKKSSFSTGNSYFQTFPGLFGFFCLSDLRESLFCGSQGMNLCPISSKWDLVIILRTSRFWHQKLDSKSTGKTTWRGHPHKAFWKCRNLPCFAKEVWHLVDIQLLYHFTLL